MAFPRNGANAEGRQRLYSCKYCDKAFTSSQALGGHQNGHRKERQVVNSLHQDPNSLFAFCNNPPPPPPPPPLQPNNIPPLTLPSLNLSLALSPHTQNFYRPSSTFSPGLTYYQNYYPHQPYQFNNINRETSIVDVGSSSRNFLFGSRLENGDGSVMRTETHRRLPNRAGLDADKENEIDLTLRL